MINEKKYFHQKLLRYLQENTDREHPVQQAVIVSELKKSFPKLDRSTVRRALGDLIADSENSRVHSLNEDQHTEDREDSDRNPYYTNIYYDPEFTTAELRWLIDGILYSRNVPHTRRDDLIGKLAALGNKYFRQDMALKKIRRLSDDEPMNPELFDNIDRISKAIEEGRKITTVYCYMGPDFTLEPVYGDPNYRQLLNPYAMVNRNGFYFLICNKDNYDDMTHYRIDRMTKVTITEEKIKPERQLSGFKAGWNLQEYMEHNINMAFGEPALITFIAKGNAIPGIIDTFGKGVSFAARKDGDYDCTVRIPLYDMERWAMQNWDQIIVTGPQKLVHTLAENFREGLGNYMEKAD